MSHSFCAGLCDARNYTIGGIEGSSGSQCFCGNDINTTTAQVAPQEECANRCQGNQTEYCGGSWRLQTFTFDCKEDDDADGGDLPILPPWPQNVTWQYHQNESYTGTPRIFVLTPRDRVDEKDGNEMEVTAVVLGTTRNDDDVRSGVLLFWRRVDVDLVNEGGCFVVNNKGEFNNQLKELFTDADDRTKKGKITKKFISQNTGATKIILDYIKSRIS